MTTTNLQDQMEVHYFQVTDLWKRLCEEHSQLLDTTFDEYSLLLSSDMDNLEKKLVEKANIINDISALELLRKNLITKVSSLDPSTQNVETVSDLLQLMQAYENAGDRVNHLEKFNNLLIDIITKIQDQNKKNQLFINKAIHSLQEIREDAMGVKSYSTYTSKGGKMSASSSK